MHRSPARLVVALCFVVLACLLAACSSAPDQSLTPEERESADAQFARDLEAKASASASAEKEAVTIKLKRPEGRPLRMLFVGDSLTAGYYATTVEDSFVQKVVEGIGGKVDILVGQQRANGAGKTGDIERVDEGADVAVIELGTDDVVDQNLESFKGDYFRLLNMIDDASPTAPLLCLGVWHENTEGYDEVIRDLCTKRGGQFQELTELQKNLDFHGPEGAKSYRGTRDTFHPNDLGHAAIADAVLYHLDVEG